VLDDSEIYYGYFSDVCSFCIYKDEFYKRKCAAFPEGIPDDIWFGKNKHTKPLPEQKNGIVYEKDKL
jgi:hypothetical protein